MPFRVYIPAFGAGLGHAIRMDSIARILVENGIKVKFSSSYETVQYLTEKGYECYQTPLLDVKWGKRGELSGYQTLISAYTSLFKFINQVRIELSHLTNFSPDLILSDSRLSPILASKILRIPSIVVLNQLKLLLPTKKMRRVRTIAERFSAEFLGTLWSFCDKILLVDLPPPFTISENSLSGIKSTLQKIQYVGFIIQKSEFPNDSLRKIVSNLELSSNKPTIFAQISGPTPTKMKILKTIIESANLLNGKYNFIISEGTPGGKTDPLKFKGGWYFEWCPINEELLSLADITIIRGGHSSIAKSIFYGKPMITIPVENHSEQISNSSKISKLSAGIMLDQRNMSPNMLQEAIFQILNDGNYRKRIEQLRQMTHQFDGLKNIFNIIREYST